MLIFQFRQAEEPTNLLRNIPYKIWDIDLIRKEIPRIPYELAHQICQLPEQGRGLRVTALMEIVKAVGPDEGRISGALIGLSRPNVSKLFIQFPDRFVVLAQVLGESTAQNLSIIENENVAKLFAKQPDKFIEFAKANGHNALSAIFGSFQSIDFVVLFSKYPDSIIEIVKSAGDSVLWSLEDKDTARLFAKYPDKFVAIAKAVGTHSSDVFRAISSGGAAENNSVVATRFKKNPDQLVRSLIEISKTIGDYNLRISLGRVTINSSQKALFFGLLEKGELNTNFVSFVDGKMTAEQFLLHVFENNSFTIEIGRILDDLHSQPAPREKYLADLSTTKILGLLISNPQYFYPSTNHMLFDRLKKDLNGRNISDLFKAYGVSNNQIRNFLFRAINYDRFYGRPNSILTETDVTQLTGLMLEPVSKSKFDPSYYLLLANALDKLKTSNQMKKLFGDLSNTLTRRYIYLTGKSTIMTLSKDEQMIMAALESILVRLNPSTPLVDPSKKKIMSDLDQKGNFEPKLYSQGGKLTIVQVFDKNDTQEEHWPLSQQWATKYGKPKQGADGEFIYEGKGVRIILYMGEDGAHNQKFILAKLKAYPNMILTFRGHVFSLQKNVPYKIFGNKNTHVLFIPGSCGSAGSTAEYISNNPESDLRFFSNTSTGRGQVTNAILDALIQTTTTTKFSDILVNAKQSIIKRGGDPQTIKVWSDGEALLSYVYRSQLK